MAVGIGISRGDVVVVTVNHRLNVLGFTSLEEVAYVPINEMLEIDNPDVRLLSIGEEPGKGDTLRKEAFELLEARHVRGKIVLLP